MESGAKRLSFLVRSLKVPCKKTIEKLFSFDIFLATSLQIKSFPSWMIILTILGNKSMFSHFIQSRLHKKEH